MELDVKKFARRIKRAKETTPAPGIEFETEGLKYLYDLLDELTEGERPMYIRDIDFKSFSAEDIEYLEVNMWKMEQQMGGGGKIARLFKKADAKAYTPAVRFF